jgi:hypothetical protein
MLYDFKKLSGCLAALESSTSQPISRLSDWKNREGADELSMAIWNYERNFLTDEEFAVLSTSSVEEFCHNDMFVS